MSNYDSYGREQYRRDDYSQRDYDPRDYYQRSEQYQRDDNYRGGDNYYDRDQPYQRNDYYQQGGSAASAAKPEVFGREKVANYLEQILDSSDTDGDGFLSRSEFDASQKNIETPLDKQTSEFVSRHFGSLSILTTDGYFSEGGISRGDIAGIRDKDALNDARNSYSDTYRDLGGTVGAVAGTIGGFAAQAADVVFLGGAVTGVSMLGHMGLAVAVPFLPGEGRVKGMAQLSLMLFGMAWGPLYGGIGGYEGGQLAGNQLASNYFARKHEPQIKAMLDDLNRPPN
jgi:hypothetical protein